MNFFFFCRKTLTCFDLFCGVATTVDGHLAAGSVRWILCKLLKGGRGGGSVVPESQFKFWCEFLTQVKGSSTDWETRRTVVSAL